MSFATCMFFCYLATLRPSRARVRSRARRASRLTVPDAPAVAVPKDPGVPKAAPDVGVPKPPPIPKMTGGAGDAKAPTPGFTSDPNAPDTPAVNPTPAHIHDIHDMSL